jgi:hypothetical protein
MSPQSKGTLMGDYASCSAGQRVEAFYLPKEKPAIN